MRGFKNKNISLVTHFLVVHLFITYLAMETLPSEILNQILSHLEHNDTTECVRVCQSWRKLIPPHVASLWSHIHLQQYAYHILDAVPIFAPFINTITLINFDVLLENALKTLNRASKHLVLQKLSMYA